MEIVDNLQSAKTLLRDAFITSLKPITDEGRDIFIGISGGSLVNVLSDSLKESTSPIPWGHIHFFFCDERYVTMTDAESTYGAYKKALFDPLGVSLQNVHWINLDLNLEDCAEDYETLIKKQCTNVHKGIPQLDLLLLGMGPDGHTCSLFPHQPVLDEQSRLIVAVPDSPKPPPQRVTFTLPLINNAGKVIFLCTGIGKADVVKEIFGSQSCLREYPASFVRPTNGNLLWILDRDAASKVA